MKISIAGTGYVGLVTGVCLSDIGHHVTCLDIDEKKVEKMSQGLSPIYEPGLEELMKRNIENGCLRFTSNKQVAYSNADIIFIAVGTPQKEDGSANLLFIEQVAKDIASHIQNDVVVVTKSTVPVGTNERVLSIMKENLIQPYSVAIVSNPEFLREGSAVHDTFHGDRIVIGADDGKAAEQVASVFAPFNIPIVKTTIKSAEMIKYASNAFLATKISFINEISNICEKLGANIEDVARAMGMDARIGSQFLNAGIGYGGSCFPKDTNALVQIAGNVQHKFELLESVINVNNNQQRILVEKMKKNMTTLKGKRIAVLGLAFKPNTDDMREAASIVVIEQLLFEGAAVVAYDPISLENAKRILSTEVQFVASIEEALEQADVALILTEWREIKDIPLSLYLERMNQPVVYDGRNCYSLEQARAHGLTYYSIGRPDVCS